MPRPIFRQLFSGADPLAGLVPPELLTARCCELIIGGTQRAVQTTVFAMSLLAAVLYPLADHALLALWLGLFALVLAARWALARHWQQAPPRDGDQLRRYQRLYRSTVYLSGTLWGSTTTFLFVADDASYQQLLTIVLIGACAVAMTTLAIDRRSTRVFLALLMVPLAIRYALEPGTVPHLHAVLALFYLLFAMGNAERVRRSLLDNLRLEREIADRQQRLNQAEQVARLGSFELDMRTGEMRWSDEHFRLWGIEPGRAVPDRALFLSRVHPDDRAMVADCVAAALREARAYQCNHRLRRADGSERYVQARAEPVLDAQGRVRGLVGSVQDITGQRESEERMRQLAFFDPLTGLPNRHLLLERLQQCLLRYARQGGSGALAFIDLDNFKYLNDTHGHDRGDELLRLVAGRVLAAVRGSDTVARLGGDEFVVMLEGLDADPGLAEQQAMALAEQIRTAIQAPYMLGGREFHSASSIGVACFGGGVLLVEQVMKRADLAMYEAKAAGRNTVRLFTPDLEDRASARSAIEADLRTALQEGEFTLHLQGQVDAEGAWTGAEALLRWQHPVRGAVSPAQMIPVAEESGLILPIGQWVLRTACQHLVRWAGVPALAHLTLAVNVSARQFRQPHFVDEVLAALHQTGANPRRLKIELTESLLLHDLEESIRKMAALRTHGVGFALDDFGTGWSSLYYLQRLPLEQLKIDQVFVRDVLSNPNNAAIARMVLSLGHTFGLQVIAEGVESEGQRDFLAAGGCHGFQGFLFGRPVPVETFEARMQAQAAAGVARTAGSADAAVSA